MCYCSKLDALFLSFYLIWPKQFDFNFLDFLNEIIVDFCSFIEDKIKKSVTLSSLKMKMEKQREMFYGIIFLLSNFYALQNVRFYNSKHADNKPHINTKASRKVPLHSIALPL